MHLSNNKIRRVSKNRYHKRKILAKMKIIIITKKTIISRDLNKKEIIKEEEGINMIWLM